MYRCTKVFAFPVVEHGISPKPRLVPHISPLLPPSHTHTHTQTDTISSSIFPCVVYEWCLSPFLGPTSKENDKQPQSSKSPPKISFIFFFASEVSCFYATSDTHAALGQSGRICSVTWERRGLGILQRSVNAPQNNAGISALIPPGMKRKKKANLIFFWKK